MGPKNARYDSVQERRQSSVAHASTANDFICHLLCSSVDLEIDMELLDGIKSQWGRWEIAGSGCQKMAKAERREMVAVS